MDKWTEQEARQLRAIAQKLFRDHWNHGSSREERENCGACCLSGYTPRGGWGDTELDAIPQPNYAGWARLYVEAGRAIPRKFRKAFDAELHSENKAYANALQKSINTFGVTFA